MNGEFAVVLFHTSSHAMRAEEVLRHHKVYCKLIPVPRQFSSDCGVCARIQRSDSSAARLALESARVEIVGIHEV